MQKKIMRLALCALGLSMGALPSCTQEAQDKFLSWIKEPVGGTDTTVSSSNSTTPIVPGWTKAGRAFIVDGEFDFSGWVGGDMDSFALAFPKGTSLSGLVFFRIGVSQVAAEDCPFAKIGVVSEIGTPSIIIDLSAFSEMSFLYKPSIFFSSMPGGQSACDLWKHYSEQDPPVQEKKSLWGEAQTLEYTIQEGYQVFDISSLLTEGHRMAGLSSPSLSSYGWRNYARAIRDDGRLVGLDSCPFAAISNVTNNVYLHPEMFREGFEPKLAIENPDANEFPVILSAETIIDTDGAVEWTEILSQSGTSKVGSVSVSAKVESMPELFDGYDFLMVEVSGLVDPLVTVYADDDPDDLVVSGPIFAWWDMPTMGNPAYFELEALSDIAGNESIWIKAQADTLFEEGTEVEWKIVVHGGIAK